MADACLDYFHAGFVEPFLDVLPKLIADFDRVATQRDFVVLTVVRVPACQTAKCRFTLCGHEVLIIVDFKQCFSRVDNFPDNHGGDLDRVAITVIDLRRATRRPALVLQYLPHLVLRFRSRDAAGFKVADTQRDLFLRIERIDPEESGFLHGSAVAAKQQHDSRIIRCDRLKAEQHHDSCWDHQNAQND